jgi:hypothetical protein
VNNTQNVFIGAINSRNIWELDNLGNYWSDYTGADKNGDAIGDIPYIVDKNNIDNYPLMTVYNTNPKLQSNHTLWVQLGIIGLVAFAVIIIGIWFFNRKKLIWP